MSSDAAISTTVPFTPLAQSARAGVTASAGYAQGYAQGWAAGSRAAARSAETERAQRREREELSRAEHEERLRRTLGLLEDAAQAARAHAAPVLAGAEAELTSAAVELAEALLGTELSERSTSLLAAVRRAMSQTGTERVVRIRLNPSDLAALDPAGPPSEVPEGVELVADPELAPGDAVTEFAEGVLDARLAPALARVRQVLEHGR